MGNEKKKTIVDEVLLDIKVIEEALAKNTKEILRATMAGEIDHIVKESVNDADYDEETIETNDDEESTTGEVGDEESTDVETNDDEPTEEPLEVGADEEGEEESGEELPVAIEEPSVGGEEGEIGDDLSDFDEFDMTAASDEEVIKVFKKLSGDDEVEVVSDTEVNIKDPESGNEYHIKLGKGGAPAEEAMEDEGMTYEGDDDVVYEVTLGDDEIMEDIVRGQGHDTEVKESPAPNKGDIDGQKSPEDKKTSGDNLDGGFTEKDPNGSKDGHADHVMESEEGEVSEGEEIEENKSRAQPDLHANRVRPEGKKENHTAPIGRANESVSIVKYNKLLGMAKQLQNENTEFKSALKEFRKMLGEAVVYNTNLTYIAKLFTEQSTSKEEKQSILKRFDDVKTLKESKRLYRTIISELDKAPIKKVVEQKIVKEQKSGSSSQITESTAYVDKEVKNIIDLMNRVENKNK